MCALILFGSSPAWAQTSKAVGFFRQNCASCHTIGGGRLTGPDLENVTQREERAWLVQFLQNPKAMIGSGDPYALKLQQEARGVMMPMIITAFTLVAANAAPEDLLGMTTGEFE
jgi:cytochrome c551/c552